MPLNRKAVGVGAVGVLLAWLVHRYLLRVRPWREVPQSRPAHSYAEAEERIARLRQRERPDWRAARQRAPLHRNCGTRVLLHGERTTRAVVLLHGFTKCPNQYDALAKQLHQKGYNVIVPRYPYHGYENVMTHALCHMTAEQLLEMVQEVVDIAQGLGEHVTVFGFSLGGLLASWVAQHRTDVDRALIVAAPFTVHTFPGWMNSLLANLFTLLPNSFLWWDGARKEKAPYGSFAYPRFTSRSFGHLLRIGQLVLQAAEQAKPAAKSIVISANPADESVDNRGAQRLVQLWRKRGADVHWHEFDRRWELAHEIVDPLHHMQQVELVYPVLLRLITHQTADVVTNLLHESRADPRNGQGPLPHADSSVRSGDLIP
jgi:carboxylesterase